MIITLRYNIEPMPHQSVRSAIRYKWVGKKKVPYIFHYQEEKVEDYKDAIRIMTKAQLPNFFKIWDEHLQVYSLTYACTHPKSWSKKKVKELEDGKVFYKDTKGDIDNYMKPVLDSLEGIVFVNDSRIAIYNNLCKIYTKSPYIELSIGTINQGIM